MQITEIMYDAPGADSGREWVEVTNLGQESADAGKYKLFENDINHGLTLVSGSATLPSGASAILADDPAKFKSDYPSYVGALFNTAFSLSNTGESLAIKNASSSVLDVATYTSTADADGTGGSLHKSGASFAPAMANPGVYPGTLTSVPKMEKPAPSPKTVKKSSASPTSTKKNNAAAPVPTPLAASAGNLVPSIPQNILWYLGLGAIILLGISGVLFMQLGKKETFIGADEFKIE